MTFHRPSTSPCRRPTCTTGANAATPAGPAGTIPSWANLTSESSAPPARSGSVLAFDGAPGAGYDILFGGATATGFLNDTWEFLNGTWTNISASACASTCPPPLAYAAMTFDPSAGALVLLGGETGCPSNGCPSTYSSAIYLFRNGSWQLGPGSFPGGDSAVAAPSIGWYAPGGCVLFFGGVGPGGPRGLTFCYNATTGSAPYLAVPGPSPLWGASMTNGSLATNSSRQFDVLFGGSTASGLLDATWVFYLGAWSSVQFGSNGAPPNRTYADMAESPAASLPGTNASGDVVLFGGRGVGGPLNDTWTFRLSSLPGTAGGTAFGNWTVDGSVPAPPPSIASSMVLDFAADRVVLTEGNSPTSPNGIAQSWAYYHFVIAFRESVPELDVGSTLNLTASAAGGKAPYTYGYSGLPPGCVGSDAPTLSCVPTRRGHFLPATTVSDSAGRSFSANLSLIVDPYGAKIGLRTELAGYLYTNVSLNETLQVDTTINGVDPGYVQGTIATPSDPAGTPLNFTHQSGTAWDATLDVGTLPLGASLHVEANYTNWTLAVTHPFDVVRTPHWMEAFLNLSDRIRGISTTVVTINTTAGGQWDGQWEDPYAITVYENWTISNLLLFGIPAVGPAVDMFVGPYILTPGVVIEFAFDSAGVVTLQGGLQCTWGISIGPVQIEFSMSNLGGGSNKSTASHASPLLPAPASSGTGNASKPKTEKGLAICGNGLGAKYEVGTPFAKLSIGAGVSISNVGFAVVPIQKDTPADGYTVAWNNVNITVQFSGDFSFTLPIPYVSAEIPDVGAVGLMLNIDPSVAVEVTFDFNRTDTPGLFGLDLGLAGVTASVGIGLGLHLEAGLIGIGLGSGITVGGGGEGTVTAVFQTAEPHVKSVTAVGKLDVIAHLLFFTLTYTVLGPGTLYLYPKFGAAPVLPAAGAGAANWTVLPRYYNGSTYNQLVWNASHLAGPAIADIYPGTTVSIAPTSAGTLLALTSDNVALPERQALGLQGYFFDAGRQLSSTPMPSVPGSISFSPQLLSLPNGTVRSVFSSLPDSAAATNDPTNLTTVALRSSLGSSSGTGWSSPGTIQDWGVPLSYVLASCGSDGTVAVLDAPSFAPGPSTPERLLLYDLASDHAVANASVAGLASLGGYDCSTGLATVYGIDGRTSLFDVARGGPLAITYATGPAWNLSAISWVTGAPGTAALLYRSASEDEVVLYDAGTGRSISALIVAPNATLVRAVAYGSGYYVFVATADGVYPYLISASQRTDLPEIPAPGIVGAGIALGGGRIVLYAELQQGNSTAPIESLALAIVNLPALPTTPPAPPPPSVWTLLGQNLATLVLSALLAVLLAAAVLLSVRRRPPGAGHVSGDSVASGKGSPRPPFPRPGGAPPTEVLAPREGSSSTTVPTGAGNAGAESGDAER